MTHQTSGCAASIAARFIPTVERESIDFQHKSVTEWNRELLWVGGILARCVYEDEMADIGRMWKELLAPAGGKTVQDDATKTWLIARALHVSKFFCYAESTPSALVAADTEHAFFTADKSKQLTVMSTQGPRSSSEVRMPNADLATFVTDIPVIPIEIAEQVANFLTKLKERNLVRDITMDDIILQLGKRALTIEEARACLKVRPL